MHRACLYRPPVQLFAPDPVLLRHQPPHAAPPQVVLLHQGMHPEALLALLPEEGGKTPMVGLRPPAKRVISTPAWLRTNCHTFLGKLPKKVSNQIASTKHIFALSVDSPPSHLGGSHPSTLIPHLSVVASGSMTPPTMTRLARDWSSGLRPYHSGEVGGSKSTGCELGNHVFPCINICRCPSQYREQNLA